MGHHKKQSVKLASLDSPSGKGPCPSCKKTVQNLRAHIRADHKGKMIRAF